jgi:hypothetical protein
MPPRQVALRRTPKKGKKNGKNLPAREPAQFVSSIQTRVADFTREMRIIDRTITQVHEWADYGSVTSTASANGYYSFSSVFTDLPDNANYSSAFDQYRFDAIEYHVIPITQSSSPATAPGYSFAMVYHDYDDTSTPVSQAAARSYANMAILGPGEKHVRKIKPHCAVAATSSGAASITGAMNAIAPWCDTTSTAIPHYGLKVVITQSNSTNVNSWYIFARLTVSLRNQR